MFFPINNNLVKNSNVTNINEESESYKIKAALNDPPNKGYFKYYKLITIPHEQVFGTGTHINFPVLISILDSDLHDHVEANGNDIAFANDTSWLNHEIELFNQTYNSTHAQLVCWVQIPKLSTSLDTTIYLYYGNVTMTSQENPSELWSNYASVWHLKESSGSGYYLKDSTINNYDGDPSGTAYLASGKIASARNFAANNDNIAISGGSSLLNGDNRFVFSFWMYPNYDSDLEWQNDGERRVFYKSSSVRMARIWRGTWQDPGKGLFQPDIEFDTYGTIYPNFEINRQTWNYIIYSYDGSYFRVIINGQLKTSQYIGSDSLISDSSTFRLGDIGSDCFDGYIDEFRLSNNVNTNGWYQTEFNNQNNTNSFIILSQEEIVDHTPPLYSNLIESSNPLELGDIEIIQINVSDISGISQVLIEFEGSNHSMSNLVGDKWQYDSWTPNSVDNYSYTIWMEDNCNNWNSTTSTIEVIDSTPPTYSNLIESADPLQFGQNETINIKVYDSPGSGVKQVLLEYEDDDLIYRNHTMKFEGINSWSWYNWKPFSVKVHSYKIYMEDNEGNWNMTSETITIVDTTAPVIGNLTESADPLELGNNITITIDVYDNETIVSTVLIELEGVNHTMSKIGGNTYEYNWTRSFVGIVNYKIYANDSDNNWNSLSSSFDIIDTTPPDISDLWKSEDPLELGNTITIAVNSTDLSDIKQIKIEFEGSNHSMAHIGGDAWEYDLWIPSATGTNLYTIWAEDNNNNWDYISDSVFVQDTTPPTYSDLVESANPVELGVLFAISINTTDLAGIQEVLIEYENSNYTMTNIGGNIWNFDAWVPNSIGNCTYKIYITDNSGNLNYLNSWILFIDTIIPNYDNLFESSDPLELGDNQIVRINAYDFAGINQCLLEYEGMNHSMTNIYGNTWQFDSWIPNNWTFYQYKIFVEDKSGNWNYLSSNITVQDTLPPSPPILNNGPSGIVNGVLVFDWQDGYDPSGITRYVLIIDNETDYLITPGYIFEVNLTNNGSGSSYFELTEDLPSGKYYYFLAQTDGAGNKSSYTVGSFEIQINDDNNIMLYIIIAIAIVSVLGSVSAIVVIKRKSQKQMKPFRKKIPLKVTLSHLEAISPVTQSSYEDETQNLINQQPVTHDTFKEEIPVEKEQILNIEELKHLGESMFEDGAYLEAIEQFECVKELLIEQGKKEEAKLISELINGINKLIKEREMRTKVLEAEKMNGDSIKIFELYQEIIEISKKLRDIDGVNMFNSEMNDYFNANKIKLIELQKYSFKLEEQADLSSNAGQYEKAIQEFEKCEQISSLLMNFSKNEINNVEKFRNKKLATLQKLNR